MSYINLILDDTVDYSERQLDIFIIHHFLRIQIVILTDEYYSYKYLFKVHLNEAK